jgi:hypothetical protein
MWLVRPVDLPVLEGIMIHVDLDKPGVATPSYFSAFCYFFVASFSLLESAIAYFDFIVLSPGHCILLKKILTFISNLK